MPEAPDQTSPRERLRRAFRRMRGAAWRARNRARLAAPPPGALVHFAIPLVSRRRANDWTQVCANLSVTLASLAAQTDPRWRAVICGQDRPDGLPEDPRIRFLPAAISDRFNDQREKGRLLTRDLRRAETAGAGVGTGAGTGYYFKLDADDILHPGLVAHILSDDNRQGYLIDKGYILDAGALARGDWRFAALFPTSPDHPKSRDFFRECGSCAAFWYDFTRGADFVSLLDARGSHVELEPNLADFGFRLARVPFPAALYVMNHGDNMRARRGDIRGKMRFFDRSPVADPAPVVAGFGLDRLTGVTPPAPRPSEGRR